MAKIAKMKGKKQKIAIKIVPYRKSYEKGIRQICWETAFLGESGREIIDDKKLMTDFLCKYYLENESDKIFVALHNKTVVGYLFGCTDTERQEKAFNRRIFPQILKKVITKRYRLGLKTFHFLFGGLIWFALFEGRIKIPKGYPAHLHMNIKDGYRRKGIGTLLMLRYMEFLLKNNVKGLHLITTSHHRLANPFYNKLGFKLYNKKPTKMWSEAVKDDVYFRIYKIVVTKQLIAKLKRLLDSTDLA